MGHESAPVCMEKINKIALAIIIKDDSEVELLRRCLNSVAEHIDKIFITGTKEPQKKIKKLCKEYGAEYSFFTWCKDFSKARNFNFSRIPKEYDWILWLDTDDIMLSAENIRQACQVADQNNISAIFCKYLYQVEIDEKGNIKEVLIEHLRERLIKNTDWAEWVGRIHETIIQKYPIGQTDFQGIEVVHLATYKDMEGSMFRNIEILEEEVIDKSHDPRPIYYLAKAYFDTRAPELLYESVGEGLESIVLEMIKDYLRKSGWAEERAQAWEYMSMVYREQSEYKKAINCLLESVKEDPKFLSAYIQLALNYVLLKDWSKALHWIKISSTVEIPKTTLVINPRDYKSMILEVLYHVYLNTGKLEETQKIAQGLVDVLPLDINKQRLKEIIELRHNNDLAHFVVKLAYHLRETNQTPQLKALINAIPTEIAKEPVLMNLRTEFLPPKTWDSDEIAIYCGPGWEKWSPKNLGNGIGGSEEAVIFLSRELSRLGWRVTVFGDPQEDEGDFEGVNYVPHYTVNWNDTFNILVSWRQIGLFDLPIKAKKSYLWNHDLLNQGEFKKERVDKIDKIIVLSNFHRQNIPGIPDDKIMISANGINI